LRAARRRILAALRVDVLDVFFAEYIQPDDRIDDVFASGGVLDELCVWKTQGTIRYVGASVHDRTLARRLVQDPRIDVLMHRYNMAHRKATNDVFPAAIETQTPVVAFTATRWGTLLTHRTEWPGDPPSAADCYRYCLAHPAVKLVLTAPRSLNELDENLEVLDKPTMSKRDRVRWERFGDLVHGCGKDAFETRWP
jgi:aryl-alcohol dehydrogenase-like predicted oxidoreductase